MNARSVRSGALAILLGVLIGLPTSTAKAGITLVITVSDGNGTATATISSGALNSVSYNNTGVNNAAITGNALVLNDFFLNVLADTNTPGSLGNPSNLTSNDSTVDFKGGVGAGGTGTVSVAVFPTDYAFPTSATNPAYVESRITNNTTARNAFNSIMFVTSVAQASGTFTPGFQSLSTTTEVSDIYSQFNRDSQPFRIYNTTRFVLPVDTSGNASKAVSVQSRDTVSSSLDDIRVSASETTPIPTPEPATLAMAIAGLPVAGLFWWRRRSSARRAA